MKEFNRHPFFKQLVTSIPVETAIGTEEEMLKYLLILNRTYWNNTYPTDIFDYEKIQYIKYEYPHNQKIQNLINIIEENIAKNYRIKMQYISRLSDNIRDPKIQTTRDTGGYLTTDLLETRMNRQKEFACNGNKK